MRRCTRVLLAAPEATTSQQWPFGKPEAKGTARKYIPYPKKILEGVAAKMADKKQDPPTLVSIANHLSNLGKGWKIARNHWNTGREVRTFATITHIYNHRPPFELSSAVGYMTVNGETSNCPIYIPQQSFAGWTAVGAPEDEPIISKSDRRGNTVEFSNKLVVTGVDYTTDIQDVKTLAKDFGSVVYCDWIPEAYDKSTKQALIIYETVEEAEVAYDSMHDYELDGLVIAVEPGVRFVPRPPSIGVEVPVDYSYGKMPTEPSFNY
eukprot:TRINITY_DN34805_c0_g1_i1.p1 TRINITY_DN34805_c0_g1~~TRINITY_DN34805_c0_g1_i1.p1  ORF type:complete len:273 (+),score=51.19 TRINITY_DN34805_c0_g1_i1:27-821(+)